MRDIHCHILPGVDDGAHDLSESLAMLSAARAAGITSIVCTPHCRDPYFDFEAMWDAYDLLVAHADGFPLTMGFEVNWSKLAWLGVGEWAPYLGIQGPSFAGSGEATLLLELDTGAPPTQFAEYYRTVFELQGMGYDVVVAHPERYVALQKDLDLAERFVSMGCKLQLSANFMAGGLMGRSRRCARALLGAGLVSYIASDAHRVEHYDLLARAIRDYAGMLRG